MKRYYVELGMEYEGEEVMRPMVVAADSNEASERIVRQTYPTARLLRCLESPLSSSIQPALEEVGKWGGQHIPVGTFRDNMEVVLREGVRMAHQYMDDYSPFHRTIEPFRESLVLDHLHEQMSVPLHVEKGAEFVNFPHNEEALIFTAAMIREAMAQELKRVTRGN
jgi:hypothetical protein